MACTWRTSPMSPAAPWSGELDGGGVAIGEVDHVDEAGLLGGLGHQAGEVLK